MLPIIAIIISTLSLSVSIFLAWRDRARVKTVAWAHRHPDTDEYAVVYIKIVNIGRRPISLRYLCGVYEGGHSSGISIANGVVKLNEGEFYETSIGKYDGMMMYMGEYGELSAELSSLYFEDTAGKKYKIKNSKEKIKAVRNGKHPLGVRTHS